MDTITLGTGTLNWSGLVKVGEQVVFAGHTATVRDGGVLHDGGPHGLRRVHRDGTGPPAYPGARSTAGTCGDAPAVITPRDEAAVATGNGYHYDRVEVAGRIVRARIERQFYVSYNLAVVDMINDGTSWTRVVEDLACQWRDATSSPRKDCRRRRARSSPARAPTNATTGATSKTPSTRNGRWASDHQGRLLRRARTVCGVARLTPGRRRPGNRAHCRVWTVGVGRDRPVDLRRRRHRPARRVGRGSPRAQVPSTRRLAVVVARQPDH